MADYISKEFMLKNLEADKMNNAEHCEPVTIQIMERFIRYVSEFPAADVQPVKRGKCVIDNEGYERCSVCNEHETGMRYFTFCPRCGARMIKDGDTE